MTDSKPFVPGDNIIPEPSPDVKNPADSITMPHVPSPVKSLPQPDSISK